MRIAVGYGTQQDILTPEPETGVEFITVQLQDDSGRPLTDVHFIPVPGVVGDLYLMPLLVAGMRESLPKLIAFFQKAVRFVNINAGAFNEAAFIDALHTEIHKPLPSPVVPQPVPVVTSGLSESVAQVQIEAYARSHFLNQPSSVVKMLTVPGAFSRNYYINGKLCLVVCSGVKDSTFMVRNDFFLNYTGDHYNNRALLGAPIEDEHSVNGGAEQRFQKGRMFWRQATGRVELYNLNGDRIN